MMSFLAGLSAPKLPDIPPPVFRKESHNYHLDNLPGGSDTAVVQIIFDRCKEFLCPQTDFAPQVYWMTADGQKRKALLEIQEGDLQKVYVPKSAKQMTLKEKERFSGSDKTGRPITAYFLDQEGSLQCSPGPLLLLKNKDSKRLSLVRSGIETARALANIPNVVAPISSFQWVTRKQCFKIGAIFPLYTGGDFLTIANDEIAKLRSSSKEEHTKWFLQMTRVVSKVFENGYIYRDIKLENFLLLENLQVGLVDFDYCSRDLCEPERWSGTYGTMAPEYALLVAHFMIKRPYSRQILSACIGEKNAVYSLGCVFLVLSRFTHKISHMPLFLNKVMGVDRKKSKNIYTQVMRWISPSFVDFLKGLDPDLIPFSYLQETLSPIVAENRPQEVSPLIELIERMVDGDPRNRPSLKEVEEKLSSF